MAMASGGGVVDDIISLAHIHRHRGLDRHHTSLTKYDDVYKAGNIMQPPNGPVYRCHDPHPEIFVSDRVHIWYLLVGSSSTVFPAPNM
jgi:hypothetical protein